MVNKTKVEIIIPDDFHHHFQSNTLDIQFVH